MGSKRYTEEQLVTAIKESGRFLKK